MASLQVNSLLFKRPISESVEDFGVQKPSKYIVIDSENQQHCSSEQQKAMRFQWRKIHKIERSDKQKSNVNKYFSRKDSNDSIHLKCQIEKVSKEIIQTQFQCEMLQKMIEDMVDEEAKITVLLRINDRNRIIAHQTNKTQSSVIQRDSNTKNITYPQLEVQVQNQIQYLEKFSKNIPKKKNSLKVTSTAVAKIQKKLSLKGKENKRADKLIAKESKLKESALKSKKFSHILKQ